MDFAPGPECRLRNGSYVGLMTGNEEERVKIIRLKKKILFDHSISSTNRGEIFSTIIENDCLED